MNRARRCAVLLAAMLVCLLPRPSAAAPPPDDLAGTCLQLIDEHPGPAAVATCELALRQAPSPRTTAALAVALGESGGDEGEIYGRVYDLTREAMSAAGDDPEVLLLSLRASLAVHDSAQIKQLQARAAELPEPDWRIVALLAETALDQERYVDAAKHIRALRGLDVPADELAYVEQRYTDETPALTRAVVTCLHVLGIAWWSWLIGLLVTVTLGLGLSLLQRARLMSWTPSRPDEAPPGLLRPLHRVVLQASMVFYGSLLVLLITAMLAGVLLVGAFTWFLGIVWWGLLIVALAAVGAILHAAALGHFVAPGTHVEPQSQPRLMELSRAAAQAVGVAPAVELYVSTDGNLEIIDQGHVRDAMFGRRTTRALTLGVALLESVDAETLGVLLLSAYAARRPTGGAGHMCDQAHRALQAAVRGYAAVPTRWINPGWYLLLGYRWLYAAMSVGPRLEQQLTADLRVAELAGSARLADAFASECECVIRHTTKLEAIAAHIVAHGGPMHDVYGDEGPRASEQVVGQALARSMDAPPPDWPRLPSANWRIAWIEARALPGTGALATSPGPAAQLLHERAQLRASANNGIRIELERRLNKFIKLAGG